MTSGDAINCPVYLETKYWQKVSLKGPTMLELFKEVKREAANENKPPVLLLIQKRQKGQATRDEMCIVDPRWLAGLCASYYPGQTLQRLLSRGGGGAATIPQEEEKKKE